MNRDLSLPLVLAAVAFAFAGRADGQGFRDPTLPIDARVADLLSQLTLAEKISLIPTGQPAIPRLNIAARIDRKSTRLNSSH